MRPERYSSSSNKKLRPRRIVAALAAASLLAAGCGSYSNQELNSAADKADKSTAAAKAKSGAKAARPTPTPHATGAKTNATCETIVKVDGTTVRVGTLFDHLPSDAHVQSRYELVGIGKDDKHSPIHLTDNSVSGTGRSDGTIFRDVPQSQGKVGNDPLINGYDVFCTPANYDVKDPTFHRDFAALQIGQLQVVWHTMQAA